MKKLLILNLILGITFIFSCLKLIDARINKHEYAYEIIVEKADYERALEDCKRDLYCMDINSFDKDEYPKFVELENGQECVLMQSGDDFDNCVNVDDYQEKFDN